MHKRAIRLALAVVLVAAGMIGGFFVVAAHQQAEAALASQHDVSARLARIVSTAGDIAAAQQAYVAPGQPDQPYAAAVDWADDIGRGRRRA